MERYPLGDLWPLGQKSFACLIEGLGIKKQRMPKVDWFSMSYEAAPIGIF
jgi:hypothetical protein